MPSRYFIAEARFPAAEMRFRHIDNTAEVAADAAKESQRECRFLYEIGRQEVLFSIIDDDVISFISNHCQEALNFPSITRVIRRGLSHGHTLILFISPRRRRALRAIAPVPYATFYHRNAPLVRHASAMIELR